MLLVIGYGNPQFTDDGIGPMVVSRLEAQLRKNVAVRVMKMSQLSPEMCEPISRAALVIFIEACRGEHVGAVACQTVIPQASVDSFAGQITLASLLASSRELYGRAPASLIISITGESFEAGTELSPQLNGALAHITDQLIGLIGKAFFV